MPDSIDTKLFRPKNDNTAETLTEESRNKLLTASEFSHPPSTVARKDNGGYRHSMPDTSARTEESPTTLPHLRLTEATTLDFGAALKGVAEPKTEAPVINEKDSALEPLDQPATGSLAAASLRDRSAALIERIEKHASASSVRSLEAQRDQLVRDLPPERRQQLEELRLEISRRAHHKWLVGPLARQSFEQISKQFPEIGRINLELAAKHGAEIDMSKPNGKTIAKAIDSDIRWFAPYTKAVEIEKLSDTRAGVRMDKNATPKVGIYVSGESIEPLGKPLSTSERKELSEKSKIWIDLDVNSKLSAKELVNAWITRKTSALQTQYPAIRFAAEGEPAMAPFRGGSKFGSDRLPARKPTIPELVGAEQAFRVSEPTLKRAPAKSITVAYFKESPGQAPGAAGEHFGALIGLYGESGMAASSGRHLHNGLTPKETLTHEIAHHLQHLSDFNRRSDSLAAEMGWTKSKTGNWLLRGKEPGEYFKYDRKKKSFLPVDLDGKSAPGTKTLTADELRNSDRLAVRPASTYFVNPTEAHAEAITGMRLNERTRRDLLIESPQLYKLAKREDQSDIDRAYGSGKKLRLPNGQVADATKENIAAVSNFEKYTSARAAKNKEKK